MKRTLSCCLILVFALYLGACAPSKSKTTTNTGSNIANTIANNLVDADDTNFQQIVDKSTTPVLVDLWATWCGPCRMIKPIVEGAARQFAGKLLVVRVDADKAPNVAKRYSKALPTLVVINKACVKPAVEVGYDNDQQTRDFISAAVSGCPDGKPTKTVDRDSGAGLFVMRSSMYVNVYAKLPPNPSVKQVQDAFDVYIRKGLPANPTHKQLAGAYADMTTADITPADPLVVAAVDPKGAAQQVGIVAGDKILSEDGISVYGRPFMACMLNLHGEKNSVLNLSIEHASGSSVERKQVSLVRGKVTGLFD